MECTKYTICNVTVTVRNMSPFSIDKRVFTLFKCVFSPSEYVSLPHLNIYSQVKFKWGKYTLIESVFSSFKYVDFPHLNVCSPLMNVRFLIPKCILSIGKCVYSHSKICVYSIFRCFLQLGFGTIRNEFLAQYNCV